MLGRQGSGSSVDFPSEIGPGCQRRPETLNETDKWMWQKSHSKPAWEDGAIFRRLMKKAAAFREAATLQLVGPICSVPGVPALISSQSLLRCPGRGST